MEIFKVPNENNRDAIHVHCLHQLLLSHHMRTLLPNQSPYLARLTRLWKNPAISNIAIPEHLAKTLKPLTHIKSRGCPENRLQIHGTHKRRLFVSDVFSPTGNTPFDLSKGSCRRVESEGRGGVLL